VPSVRFHRAMPGVSVADVRRVRGVRRVHRVRRTGAVRWRRSFRSILPALLVCVAATLSGLGTRARAAVAEIEPNDTCPGQALAGPGPVDPASLTAGDLDWYHFDLPAGVLVTIEAVPAGTPPADPFLEFYAACGERPLVDDDDSGPGLGARIERFAVELAGSYRVRCRTLVPGGEGGYSLSIDWVAAPPTPANDDCSGAIPLDRCGQGRVEGTITGANDDLDPGPGGCTGYAAAGPDVVYHFALEAADRLRVLCGSPDFDAALYVVTGCAQPLASGLSGADHTGLGGVEELRVVAPEAGTYFLVLDSYGAAASGSWWLEYEVDCSPAPVRACCTATCVLTTAEACSGVWLDDVAACDPLPCAIPVEGWTWGRLKSRYR